MLKNHHFEKQKTLKEEYIRIDFKRKSFKASYQKKQFKLKSYIDADGVLKNFNLPKETKISRQFIVA